MKELLLTFVFLLVVSVGYSQAVPKASYEQKTIKVQVFPNPTTSFFRIDQGHKEIASIYLYNLIGKRMKTYDPRKEADFYVDDLSSGMYLVQMVDAQGKILATNRLTKR